MSDTNAAEVRNQKPTLTIVPLDDSTLALTITLPVVPPHVVYRDYITLTVDHPSITLSDWQSSSSPIVRYDKKFKKDKAVFPQTIQLIAQAHSKDLHSPENVHIHLTYMLSNYSTLFHSSFSLRFDGQQHAPLSAVTMQAVEAGTFKNDQIKTVTHVQQSMLPMGTSGTCSGYPCLAIGSGLIILSYLLISLGSSKNDTRIAFFSLFLGLIFLFHISTLFAQ